MRPVLRCLCQCGRSDVHDGWLLFLSCQELDAVRFRHLGRDRAVFDIPGSGMCGHYWYDAED